MTDNKPMMDPATQPAAASPTAPQVTDPVAAGGDQPAPAAPMSSAATSQTAAEVKVETSVPAVDMDSTGGSGDSSSNPPQQPTM